MSIFLKLGSNLSKYFTTTHPSTHFPQRVHSFPIKRCGSRFIAPTGHTFRHTPHFVHFFTRINCFAVLSKSDRASSLLAAFTEICPDENILTLEASLLIRSTPRSSENTLSPSIFAILRASSIMSPATFPSMVYPPVLQGETPPVTAILNSSSPPLGVVSIPSSSERRTIFGGRLFQRQKPCSTNFFESPCSLAQSSRYSFQRAKSSGCNSLNL